MCQKRAAAFLARNGLLKTSLRGGSREEGNMFYRDYIGIIGIIFPCSVLINNQ